MTVVEERALQPVRISRCNCGAEMGLKAIERRSPHVEVQIFSCNGCLRELRVHLSNDDGPELRPGASGL
jgi:hypothetical protein